MILLTRRYKFSASHRLHAAHLGHEENRELYGKCNNPFGHGHDYTIEVSVAGEMNEQTGKVIRVEVLDRLMQERVLSAFDHKNLNAEVPEFMATPPTTENLALEIRKRLKAHWKSAFPEVSPVLRRVRIYETKRNIFEISEHL
jgi:6-pyruvoyltetrahydropterin/6-carboxytetrahydropterin synthase